MSKLQIKFELTGLKFEITGEKDNVSAALASLQQQVAAIAQSAAATTAALDGRSPESRVQRTADGGSPLLEGETRPALNSSSVRPRKRSTAGQKTSAEAIAFAHDPEKFGFPKQDWNTATKAMWLLHVIEAQTGQKDATAPVLAATFKHYFKEFGNLLSHNVSRDLGGAKKKGLVNSDPSKSPETWYLLSAGKSEMQSLIENQSTAEAASAE